MQSRPACCAGGRNPAPSASRNPDLHSSEETSRREVIAAPRPGLDFRHHYGHWQSPAIRAGGLIFCSGMLPIDPETGERRHGTLTSETHVIFGNLKLLLESAGSSLDPLVQGHALIYDRLQYHVLNCLY